MKNGLVEARKSAEEAVRDMAEGDLKLKAFETILAHLLANAASVDERPRSSPQAQPIKTSRQNVPKSSSERILFIKSEGFFRSQRSISEIRTELKKNGWHYAVTALSGPLQKLVQKRELRRENAANNNGRKGWKYSEF